LNTITIAAVDDHPLFLEGVSQGLSQIEDFTFVASGESAEEAVAIAMKHRPEVMLLDIAFPGGGGLEAIEAVRVCSPSTKVIMLTACEEIEALVSALRRGAAGYVVKGVGLRDLARAIRHVSSGERYVSSSLAASVSSARENRSQIRSLTPREIDIMRLVSEGWPNKVIAARLGLQEKTVKHHMTSVLRKLGVANRTEAALRWRAASASSGAVSSDLDRR